MTRRHLLLFTVVIFGAFLLTGAARRTVITVGDDILQSIHLQNVASQNGDITIAVDTLEAQVQLGDAAPVYLRNNAGTLEYLNANSDWTAVGSGDGGSSAPEAQSGTRWIDGDGSGIIASCQATTTRFDLPAFSLFAIVRPDRLNTAESLFRRTQHDGYYNPLLWELGKDSSNRLTFTVNTVTYTSQAPAFTQPGKPLEIGVQYDQAQNTVTFCYDGVCESAQTATEDVPWNVGEEIDTLGEGFDGGLCVLWIAGAPKYEADARHTPMGNALSQCPACLVYYGITAGEGTSLTDHLAAATGNTAWSLTLDDGVWMARGGLDQ